MNKDGNREQADEGWQEDNEVSRPRDATIINVSCSWSQTSEGEGDKERGQVKNKLIRN